MAQKQYLRISRPAISTHEERKWASQTLEFQKTSSKTKDDYLPEIVKAVSIHKFVEDSSPVTTDHLTM